MPAKGARVSNREKLFWSRIERMPNGCWQWNGATNGRGYGHIHAANGLKQTLAHRYSYEHFKGPIPAGLQIDHLCRNRACVNPDHLEAVTSFENSIRGAHPNFVAHRLGFCKRGHQLSTDNLYFRKDRSGQGTCKTCCIERSRARRARKQKENHHD